MRCPRCSDRGVEEKTGNVSTGKGKLDYIIACFGCSWQIPIRELEAWLKRWGYRNEK